jgi:ferredoxin-NADP reductase
LLSLVLAGVAYTGKQKGRKENFDRFIYLHNVLVIIWPILLFLHGSQGWIGVGFPLVVFTSTIPVLAYAFDRTTRALRYFLYAGTEVQIVGCTVRPGKNGTPDGGLVYLKIQPPPHLWKFHPGMYAFLCMPEFAPLQWHPFTICSGKYDPTVDFLIAGVGDWTRELGRRAILARDGKAELPKVGIDGPYTAPTQSALSKDILVAVGAGVGITPFLSLMSSIISVLDMATPGKKKTLKLKEAHFYWLTRSVDEFLFGRDLFSKIVKSPQLRDRVFLHLHTTAREPAKDPAAFLFREAVKRQSVVDRQSFDAAFKVISSKEEGQKMLTGPQLPWCWVNSSKQDVLWLCNLVRSDDEDRETDVAESMNAQGHWSTGLVGPRSLKRVETLCEVEDAFGQKDRAQALVKKAEFGKRGRQKTDVVGKSTDGLMDGTKSTAFTKTNESEGVAMLPVVFGRPDFASEVRAIGKARPEHDVDIYICGNDAIVKGLQEVVIVCNAHAERDFAAGGERRQNYFVHYERFG